MSAPPRRMQPTPTFVPAPAHRLDLATMDRLGMPVGDARAVDAGSPKQIQHEGQGKVAAATHDRLLPSLSPTERPMCGV